MISIDGSIGKEEGGRSIIEVLEDVDQADLDELIDREKILHIEKECLLKLSPREEQILRLRFGIADELSCSDEFELNKSEISAISNQGEV